MPVFHCIAQVRLHAPELVLELQGRPLVGYFQNAWINALTMAKALALLQERLRDGTLVECEVRLCPEAELPEVAAALDTEAEAVIFQTGRMLFPEPGPASESESPRPRKRAQLWRRLLH